MTRNEVDTCRARRGPGMGGRRGQRAEDRRPRVGGSGRESPPRSGSGGAPGRGAGAAGDAGQGRGWSRNPEGLGRHEPASAQPNNAPQTQGPERAVCPYPLSGPVGWPRAGGGSLSGPSPRRVGAALRPSPEPGSAGADGAPGPRAAREGVVKTQERAGSRGSGGRGPGAAGGRGAVMGLGLLLGAACTTL